MNSRAVHHLSASSSTLTLFRERIDRRLVELLPPPHDSHDRVAAAMHEGTLAPGKRTRPLMMLLVSRGLGFSHDDGGLLDVACAVEMVHTASLFLDDLPCMDNAWLRRGRLSAHARYGQDVAVLGAVALLSRAWCIVASADGLPPALRMQLVNVLCDAVGHDGLVRGQYRDLHEGSARRAEGEILSANQQKTGVLFTAALDMAARVAGAKENVRRALRNAASDMGQAFQMRDDLEDGNDQEAALTKDRHKDDGKSTLVALLGRAEVERRMRIHLQQAEQQLRHAFTHDPDVAALMLQAFGVPQEAASDSETDADDPARNSRHTGRPALRPGNGAALQL
jgi:geranylgeranyl diphosphate synthase, type II